VLLVVAADESVMPQTVEHFQICKLLEIPRGIIVITKKNLVEEELLSLVEVEVRELVQGTRLERAPIVAVDSVSGEGMELLSETLLEEIRKSEEETVSLQSSRQVFRLPIDRVFTIRGFGTVITGTPYAGSLKKGNALTVHPSGRAGKVRGIEIFKQKTDLAVAGQRTALNLSGLEKEDLERGMVISAANTFTPSHMVDTIVHLLATAARCLKHRGVIRFHHGSAELIGRIYLLEGDQLRPGKSMLAQLRLQSPAVYCPKDHFILRRYSPITTIGGGVILDGIPEKHLKKDLARLLPELRKLQSMWELQDSQIDSALVEYFVKLHGYAGISLPDLVSRTGFLKEYLIDLLNRLDSTVLVSQEPILAVSKPGLEDLKTHILDFLADFHSNKPLAPGVPREELKERFLARSSNSYFQFVLDLLKDEKQIQTSASTLSLYGRQVELSPKQEKVREEILKLIKEKAFQPPGLDELVQKLPHDPDDVRDVYYFLLQRGELIRVSDDIVLWYDQITFLKTQLRRSFPSGQTFTVPEFKNLFKISRKYAIPFLEFLDRERVTRRIGDKRLVL
ncbi:SelB C-terminal domain-containing protein, partial [Acidobacteria bacterium AH-259-G07]|nr:SelB C-terminal domain-containing protein [Acidobacteria bacterium AH-259-G07]